jgi:hypothetical protein|tara:strand:- start:1028 stop:1147 length:120 start_codon:yes stop_codon:yes gene_type:complete
MLVEVVVDLEHLPLVPVDLVEGVLVRLKGLHLQSLVLLD